MTRRSRPTWRHSSIGPGSPWPLPLVEGDRDLLFIAVQNLVANAIKFSAPGDTVEVRASEDGDALLLEVADTGAGIPADEIGQVRPVRAA
jgi:two-component system OmpR family sensor kinase